MIPKYEMRFGSRAIVGPYIARSASDKTEDWPFWYVTSESDGRLNCLRFVDYPLAMFTSKEMALAIAADANKKIGSLK